MMSFKEIVAWAERQIWMRWFLALTDPLHKPIGDDIYVQNFWLRLSTWRSWAVLLPVGFVLGWFVLPNLVWFGWGLLRAAI